MKKALTSFKNFLYSEFPMMSLSLAYCLVIAPTNTLLNFFEISGSSRSILSISSDSVITSGSINLESNERYKRKLEWYNILNHLFLRLRNSIKTIKYWNYRLEEHDIQLLTGSLNAFNNFFFSIRFLRVFRLSIRFSISISIGFESPIGSMSPKESNCISLNTFQYLTTLKKNDWLLF